ncbi:ADP-ribosylglycohydrolase family protein [Myxacorys almedinensis]|uniref:ADP-ribosylglycohydrolase family protein n=1 Tax=Myxacorys almedinensis A TaxID=2690445 RepID=A0A8J8CJH5_9CYAN|nr:ADP-ribosylglycohydrolase family protein [Myxacorys almedinensis]NDJ17616.1 hypothetical protein [Myxacorys almedinensis A]
MQYGLLNRFQATLLGAAIGEMIGQQSLPMGSSSGQLGSSGFGGSLLPVTQFYAESLITPNRLENPSDPVFQLPLNTAEAAIALLPVFLFFHEDPRKLRQNIQDVLEVWQTAEVSPPDLLAIAHPLSQALLETLDVPTCIPQTLIASRFETLPMLQFAPKNRLQHVQTLLAQPIGLEEAVRSIVAHCDESAPSAEACIAIALYCFLSTVGDFRLSLLRAAQAGYQPSLVCSLTGALSGAHNATIAIPIEWRLQMADETLETMLRLATQLFAQWSGVHDLACSESLLFVAAPRAMHNRPIRRA